MWGTSETLLVIALMVAGYWYSGVLARRRTAIAAAKATDPGDLVAV